ncbi:hypothetical protein [Streptomyces sp. NPDC000410]|uniref:hypothetical protein n=1 Tax=Streptomyces sp. NPDC000410 TaxID=3154254 RepID=UPI00331DBC05
MLELVKDEAVQGREDVLVLISKIHSARQWESAALAASPENAEKYREKIHWEASSRNAVSAGREVFRELTRDSDSRISELALELLSLIE